MIRHNNFYKKQSFPELPEGTIFNFAGEYFKVVAHSVTLGCNKCGFKVERAYGGAGCIFKNLPSCCEEQRKDKKDVVYMCCDAMDAVASTKQIVYLKIDDDEVKVSNDFVNP